MASKGGATALLLIVATYLVRMRLAFDAPELQIDRHLEEVRIISRTYRSDVLREVYAFSELEGFEIIGNSLHLLRADGAQGTVIDLRRRD